MDLGPAHAGRGDRHVDLGQGRGELRFESRQPLRLAAPLQAFDQTVQRPDIVGMLGAALDPPAQAKIVAIDFFSLGVVTLLHQQRGQRVAGRVHPGPWLGVIETVVAVHRLAETGVGLFVVAPVVLDLAVGMASATPNVACAKLLRNL